MLGNGRRIASGWGFEEDGVGATDPGCRDGVMFGLGPATKIYIADEGVDMRKGFDGLFGLVRDRLGEDPLSGHLFLFSNRSLEWRRMSRACGSSADESAAGFCLFPAALSENSVQ